MTEVHGAIKALKARLADTDGGFLMDVKVSRENLRTLVDYAEHLAGVPVRPFKVGDKVQEICDDIGDEKPVGVVTELGALGQHVTLENGRYAGRRLYYYDNEIEPYEEPVAPRFRIGQKVEVVNGVVVQGLTVKAGRQGKIWIAYGPGEAPVEYEVAFKDEGGSWSIGFNGVDLKEVV